ncbi:MAG: DUF2924 domain-containing protein [Rhizobiaceae bacterium]
MVWLKELEHEIAAIGDLPREELVERWVKAHGCLPPKGIKRGLLERSAAWHQQATRLGGFKPDVRRSLKRLICDAVQSPAGNLYSGGSDAQETAPENPASQTNDAVPAAPNPSPPLRPQPAIGTRLVREWNGRMHVVEVTDEGFVWDGKSYRSLSAIARRITGAHWSGPRFFGL